MATYSGKYYYTISTGGTSDSSSTSTWTSNDNVYFGADSIMSKDTREKTKSKSDKDNKSKTLKYMIDHIGLPSHHHMLSFRGPGNFQKENILIRDIKQLGAAGYPIGIDLLYTLDDFKNNVPAGIGVAFMMNVIESVPTLMERALILKNVVGKFSSDIIGILFVGFRTEEELQKEAEENGYKKKDRGFLITDPEISKRQTYVEAIGEEGIHEALDVGNIQISKFKKYEGENCIGMLIKNHYV